VNWNYELQKHNRETGTPLMKVKSCAMNWVKRILNFEL